MDMQEKTAQFRARSGRLVKPQEDGSVRFDHGHGYLSRETAMDAEEYFQAKRDEELGRWRSRVHPNYVVYLIGYDALVVGEHVGLSERFARDVVDDAENRVPAQVAFEYFEAHPERKPWEDAKEGEVWIITPSRSLTMGDEPSEYPAIFQADRFRDHGGSWDAHDIIAARRIWPEDAS
ncbi:hypothetical protein [Microbacterium sp. XT11]|uniref:hypothetical protein n=1 Tax=Microbacterium sp. XT11 TaxID=367477 RepID=UPI000B24984B|nr:hypothetical protein [Microbacterium sp. XT11]